MNTHPKRLRPWTPRITGLTLVFLLGEVAYYLPFLIVRIFAAVIIIVAMLLQSVRFELAMLRLRRTIQALERESP